MFLSWSTEEKSALTDAELANIRLVIEGRTNRAIASARGVSVRTVANQLATAYRKLGVASRFELLAKVRRLSR